MEQNLEGTTDKQLSGKRMKQKYTMISINTTEKRFNLTDIISYIGEWFPSKTD